MSALLQAERIDKHYGGVHALDRVDFDVAVGEVHALVGENGAGKSTLGKIVAGVVRPDSGRLRLDGHDVTIPRPVDAQRLGISIIFQELDLFPNLTVAENIAIRNLHVERGQAVRMRKLARDVRPFMEQVGLTCPPHTLLESLPIGQMQLTAVARSLSMNARLIVMDEPTSSLEGEAVDTLFDLIRKLRDTGVSIIYVSHKMDEIFRIADRITVLRDGRRIDTKAASETDVDDVIRMMVGRDVSDVQRRRDRERGEVLLSVRNLTTAAVRGVSFDLRAGEVLGIAGLAGAGRSEIGAALFGLDPIQEGEVAVHGRRVHARSPRRAMRAGLGLLPEDRKLQGLMMDMSVKHNATMSILGRLQTGGFIHPRAETRAIGPVHKRILLKAASPDVPVHTLSGGNQQKVLLSRWLLVNPDVIFLDDPTRGIDVGAKQDIYGVIEELADDGKGVIFVSSELPELLRCCDRILVLHEGEPAGILDAADATQETIMALATRSAAAEPDTTAP
jgi:ABC-type sugar transport system ATPase subunit